jgi:hypothetical protein
MVVALYPTYGTDIGIEVYDMLLVLAGMSYTLINQSNLPEFNQCLINLQFITSQILKASNDLASLTLEGIISGLDILRILTINIHGYVTQCRDIKGDIHRVEIWLKVFNDPRELARRVSNL